jgi:hypothetical protein
MISWISSSRRRTLRSADPCSLPAGIRASEYGPEDLRCALGLNQKLLKLFAATAQET